MISLLYCSFLYATLVERKGARFACMAGSISMNNKQDDLKLDANFKITCVFLFLLQRSYTPPWSKEKGPVLRVWLDLQLPELVSFSVLSTAIYSSSMFLNALIE